MTQKCRTGNSFSDANGFARAAVYDKGGSAISSAMTRAVGLRGSDVLVSKGSVSQAGG